VTEPLAPCPFPCGNEENPRVNIGYSMTSKFYHVVHDCGASGPCCKKRKDAIAAWNRRDDDVE